ncbi:MAG: ATP-dependent DNA helicase RecG [Anaerolineae bacterium]
MSSPFETLYKVLSQEKQRGCDNRLVIGGLEKLADTWAPQAIAQVTDPEEQQLIQEIATLLRRYPELEVSERASFLNAILDKIAARRSTLTAPVLSPNVSVAEKAEPAPPPQRPRARTARRVASPFGGLDESVERLPGIKKGMAERLARLGIRTVGDLLTHFPRRYIDYRTLKTISQLRYGEEVTILGVVQSCQMRDTRSGKRIVSCILSDRTGVVEITWFNQPWLVDKLPPGTPIVVSGRVDQYLGRLVFQHPEWEEVDRRQIHTGRLVPVYPLTEGLTQKWMRDVLDRLVRSATPSLPDYLPTARRERLGMPALGEALRQIHFPDNPEALEQARRRLAFDELLFIQLGVLRQRHRWRSEPARPVHVDRNLLEKFVAALPFGLTSAQRRVLEEIMADLEQAVPMNRLLQGDVGSGKTVVALAAMVVTAANGGQSAMMAPTEILAEQHYRTITRLLEPFAAVQSNLDLSVRLLTGSTPAAERETTYADIASGRAKLVVGTHALIQETVDFHDLRLVVIDEQHRFGVQQRTALRDKGYNPHMLVMSATPIPRSLALTLYGDLDLSVIDEMPPGRQQIKTYWLSPLERERAYSFIRSQVEQGRQAFIICPLVEESDKIEAKSAVEEYARLSNEVFPDLKLGLLHGRMSAEEKEAVMTRFRNGELHILVSTAVVEVGIDVPNATVMLVEGANRFGLAQLHQFRGRVGRGEHPSYCLLLADATTPEAEARLRIVSETHDGFRLAEEDLKLRGPGEFFGTRQSGLPDIRVAQLSDMPLLQLAREEAQDIFRCDPDLSQPEHQLLAQKVQQFWRKPTDLS